MREALTRLAVEGLVEIAPNRGARVASWTLEELKGVFDLRTALEPRITALATANATSADLDELDALAQEMIDVGQPGEKQDLDALVSLNREFHGRLATLANHPALTSALNRAIQAPIVLRNFHAYDEASLRRSLAHHAEIVTAMRVGDAAWAEAVMIAHLRNAWAVMARTVSDEATDT